MGRTSSEVKHRYNKKVYDQVLIFVPKGEKDTIKAAAQEVGESVNMYIQKSVLARRGLNEWPSKSTDTDEETE